MPRAEVGTPKWLANKMKAKGLQKLRWYCQMCEKQCRDENGFKCHRLSEGHQRQMQIFCQNPDRFMDEFSSTFEKDFMKLMKTRYCRTRVLANTVYTEMIADKQHVHMNSTIWVTLSEFVQYLGHSGKCKIDHTPKGWFLEYIDREKLEREKQERLKRKKERTLEEANERRINELIEEAEKNGKYKEPDYVSVERATGEKISLGAVLQKKTTEKVACPIKKNVLLEQYKITKVTKELKQEAQSLKQPDTKRKVSSIDQLMQQNEQKKRVKAGESTEVVKEEIAVGLNDNTDEKMKLIKPFTPLCWLTNGLIVKVIDKNFKEGKYYKQKGVIIEVDERCTAKLRLLNDTNVIEVPQQSLESVIPNIGGFVRIVNGKWCGHEGHLAEVNFEEYTAAVKIGRGDDSVVVDSLQFEDICKVFIQS